MIFDVKTLTTIRLKATHLLAGWPREESVDTSLVRYNGFLGSNERIGGMVEAQSHGSWGLEIPLFFEKH